MFTRKALAKIAEAEGKKKLVWTPGSQAEKYKAKFASVFGRGSWQWCGAFVTWCCEQAGLDIPVAVPKISKFGYTFALVEAWQQWGIAMGFYHDNDGVFEPEAGDITIFDWDQINIHQKDTDWDDHVGVNLYKEGKSYVSAEGNTGKKTDIKKRNPNLIQGWVRIPDGFTFSSGVVAGPVADSPIDDVTKPAFPTLSRMLREGSRGEDVKELQRLLNLHGANLDEDGLFGPKLEVSVQAFQKNAGLTVDGIVWVATWKALHEGMSVPAPVVKEPDFVFPIPVAVPMGSAMKRLPAKAATVTGMDLSDYQPTMDYAAAKKAGVEFCWAKSTEGSGWISKTYDQHKKGCEAAGILFGAYHFFRANVSVQAQVDNFLKKIGSLDGQLTPMLDLEEANGVAGVTVIARAREMLKLIEQKTGRRPGIYTGPYFFQGLGKTAVDFEKYPLWVAHYGTNSPLVPPPWSNWTAHQFTDKFKLPGRSSGIDASYFNGTLAELKAQLLV